MEIKIDTSILISNKLTISEYLYLRLLYEESEDTEIYEVIDQVDVDLLQLKGYLKILESEIVLRKKAVELFEGKGLYNKFLASFPVKTPSGRYLSPLRSNTIKGKEVEAKWKKLFKNKPHLEQKAYDVLQAELEWRRKTNQLEFIHNIITWLNQGDYENYEYLLEEDIEDNFDLM